MNQYPNPACERNKELVLQLFDGGMSLTKIAKRIGTKPQIVSKFVLRHGRSKEQFQDGAYGPNNHGWKGGRTVDKHGYVLLLRPDHPRAKKHTGYVQEHRLVMEEFLGRFLLPTEVVHHINGIRDDNRVENLQVFQSNAEHLAHELKGRCPNWSPEGRENIQKAQIRIRPRWRFSSQKKSGAGGVLCSETTPHLTVETPEAPHAPLDMEYQPEPDH